MATEIDFMVGGEVGQGVQTVGFAFMRTASSAALYVFADWDSQRDGRIDQNGEAIVRIRKVDRILHGQA